MPKIVIYKLNGIPFGFGVWAGWVTDADGQRWSRNMINFRPQWLVGMVARHQERRAWHG